jgi:DNA-binding beta-propeller fold protein YncE
MKKLIFRTAARFAALGALLAATSLSTAGAAEPRGFLEGIRRHAILGSTVPDNGDQNPYAIVVAPVSAGKIQKDDVLVTNFNNSANLQGLGSTIVSWSPATKRFSLFAQIPRNLPQCPGGVGLGTAMTMLKSGWVIVGSAPSTDGTTATKGAGCLIVLDAQGQVASVLAGPTVNMPWGNMATIDHGATATIFVSNAGFGVGAPDEDAPVVNQATVLRLDLAIAAGKPPVIAQQTVVGSGFGAQADKDVFLIGPTGLALAADGSTLYVSDATGNRIMAIADAVTRTTSGGTGRLVTENGLMRRPLAMAMAPNGHLLVMNGLNGQVVEIDPLSGQQIYARWIDPNKAQSPPGSGDLFGVAMTPAGNGFYYVEDEVNMLVLAQ